MNIEKAYPPNIADIRAHLSPSKEAVYCYGDIVYNPSGNELPEDVWWHEAVHMKQQEQWTSPQVWWSKYLLDPAFRLEQEVEAYRAQYAFIKEHYPYSARKAALFELASHLRSPMYGLKLTHGKAESMLR